MSSTDIYHVTDNLATKVPCHQISAQEFDDNNHLVVSWFIKSHPGLSALRGIFSNETTTPLMSQLKSNEMVRRGIRCQDKFLNRQGDSSTSRPQSSTTFVEGSKEEVEYKRPDEDDKKAKRKRYSLRENTRTANKVKREAQSYMKTRWNKCQKMRVGTFNRLSAERDMEDIMSNVKEELQKDQREMYEQFTKKMQEAILSFQVQSYMNSDFDSALVQVGKQLTVIPDSIMRIKQMMSTYLDSSQIPPLGRQFLQTNDTFFRQTDDQGIGEKRIDVGCVYVDDHQNLPIRTPAQLKFICIVMVTKKTELNVVLRYPSIGSPWNFLSHNRMGSSDIHPLMDEISVMETHLAGEILCHQISAQEFDDNNQVDRLWLIKNYSEPAALHGIFNKETTIPLLSQLKSNEMVRFGILREVNFFNRQGDSSTSHPQSSTISVKGSKEKLDHESDEDNIEVMESKGTLFKSPTLRHVLKFEARKRVGGTELLDHLLKHVAGKLAPGGAKHCRRRTYADGQKEYWLESSDLVKVMKEAGLQDPCWTPPPGWTPGDCPSQDPLCAKELRLLKEENAKIKREMNEVVGSLDKYCTSAQLTSKLSKVRQNCGGAPKNKQSKANKKATENQFPIILIDDDINLDDHLKIDILKGNERFSIPVADQGEYLICGSICLADIIGLTYSLKRQTFRPVIAAQEPIDWLKLQEPDYVINKTLQSDVKFHDDGHSQPFAMPDICDFVKENGIHLEANYPLKRGIFYQSLSGEPDHFILIEGYGEYEGNKFFRIKNSWSSKWAGKGKGHADIAVRQVRKFTYISGDVYCMGPKPPKRIVVFYTTKKSKKLAEQFVGRSNEKYASAPLTNCVHTSGYPTYCRHADFIFISNDLETYASSAKELELKLKKESLVLFLLTNRRADQKYLTSLYALSDMENKGKCLQNLQYSVFGLQIDEKIDSGLHYLGASCFNESVKDDGEVTFTKWREMIWTKLDEYGVEKV